MNIMDVRLAIFDLDGTLLNTIADLGAACNVALEYFGFPVHELYEYPRLVGNGVNKLLERALPDGEKTEDNIMRLREVFVSYYDNHNTIMTKPYEGVPAVLKQLKRQHYMLAVASNKYQSAAKKIVEHYFPNIFDLILGERNGCPRKPDPQIVYDIVSTLPHASATFYIGDSDVDIQTAQNAGLPVVACAWGFCKKEDLLNSKPDYIIQQPEELLRIL